MKKKTFLSKFAARFMAATLMVSSVFMAGCYKDDGLDVTFPGGTVVIPDAAYSISGTVNDFETGDAVNLTSVTASVGTAAVDGNGAFHVTLTKADVPENGVTVNLTFKAEGYDDVQRSVFVKHIADGTSVVYPLSVTLRKASVYENVVYDLKFIVKNAVTGEAIEGITPVVDPAANAEGYYAAGEYIVKTPAVEGQYYASTTAISLPEVQVIAGGETVKTSVIEIYVQPITSVEPVKEYINISGSVVDKNGHAAVADEITLDGTDMKVTNASEFRFTVLKENKNYTVTATKDGESVQSTSVNANGGNYNCVLVFSNIGEDLNVALPYVLTVNAIDAETKSPITVANWTVNGETVETAAGEYEAGNYTIQATADGYNVASVLVTLNPVYGKPGEKAYHGVTIEMTKAATPEVTSVKIYGEVLDSRGILTTAQRIYMTNVNVEPVYNSNHFSFTVKKDAFTAASDVVAEVKDATGSTTKTAKATVTPTGIDAYYVVLNFDFIVINGQEVNVQEPVQTEESAQATSQLEINYMNNNEEAATYTVKFAGYAGTRYTDFAKLQSDIAAAYPNEEIRNVVWNKIKELVPEAKESFMEKVYEQNVTVPGWTLLNSADVTTTTDTVTYELTVNGITITFTVETINNVAISVTEKNMTHMGHDHTHGHGHGDSNNAGGGIGESE